MPKCSYCPVTAQLLSGLDPLSRHPRNGALPRSGGPDGASPTRKFTDEYQAEVVQLIRSSGKTVDQVARDLNLTKMGAEGGGRAGQASRGLRGSRRRSPAGRG